MAVCCMRVESDKPIGEGKGWIHKMSEAVKVAPPRKREVRHDVAHWGEVADACYRRADAAQVRSQLADELGVSVESLERLGVGSGFDDFRHLSFSTWPERRGGGKTMGVIRRYRVPVTEAGGNKLTMEGSRHGLYLPLDWWRSSGPVLAPEGGSDTAALVTLGISAVGRPSNAGGVNMLIGALAHVQRPIIILGERDRKPDRVGSMGCGGESCDGCMVCHPGRYGARVTAERLKEALPRKSRVLWRMPPEGFKDVREWLNKAEQPTAAKLLNRLGER